MDNQKATPRFLIPLEKPSEYFLLQNFGLTKKISKKISQLEENFSTFFFLSKID